MVRDLFSPSGYASLLCVDFRAELLETCPSAALASNAICSLVIALSSRHCGSTKRSTVSIAARISAFAFFESFLVSTPSGTRPIRISRASAFDIRVSLEKLGPNGAVLGFQKLAECRGALRVARERLHDLLRQISEWLADRL
jgi:hypothetical protein